MMAATADNDPTFSADLVCGARELREFLRALHTSAPNKHGVLYINTPQLREATRVYAEEFLPSVAAHGAAAAGAPTIDVMWVWFLHRLAPVAYMKDCTAAFGHVPDADPDAPLAFRDGDAASVAAPAPAPAAADEGGKRVLRISCDIPGTAERQGTFLWQVRWAEYDDDGFLRAAAVRYGRLLGLWARQRAFLVPTYDMVLTLARRARAHPAPGSQLSESAAPGRVRGWPLTAAPARGTRAHALRTQDIMWHAHMCRPSAYIADTKRICGFVVDHDDSVNDRSAGSRLNRGADATGSLWAETYGGDHARREDGAHAWAKRGGMFRGHPPDWYWMYPQLGAAPDTPATAELVARVAPAEAEWACEDDAYEARGLAECVSGRELLLLMMGGVGAVAAAAGALLLSPRSQLPM